jgi:hypothetical protein
MANVCNVVPEIVPIATRFVDGDDAICYACKGEWEPFGQCSGAPLSAVVPLMGHGTKKLKPGKALKSLFELTCNELAKAPPPKGTSLDAPKWTEEVEKGRDLGIDLLLLGMVWEGLQYLESDEPTEEAVRRKLEGQLIRLQEACWATFIRLFDFNGRKFTSREFRRQVDGLLGKQLSSEPKWWGRRIELGPSIALRPELNVSLPEKTTDASVALLVARALAAMPSGRERYCFDKARAILEAEANHLCSFDELSPADRLALVEAILEEGACVMVLK